MKSKILDILAYIIYYSIYSLLIIVPISITLAALIRIPQFRFACGFFLLFVLGLVVVFLAEERVKDLKKKLRSSREE